jgi:hypothetical protein
MADDSKPTTQVETPKAPEAPKQDAAQNAPAAQQADANKALTDPQPVQEGGRGVGLHNR